MNNDKSTCAVTTDERNIIEITKLTKIFGDFVAVNELSLRVTRGEIVAFLGPNGAGKSTTIKMLTTLLQPTRGTISVDGLCPQTQQDAVRKVFGIVFQDPSLDDELTAWENLEFHGVLYGVPKTQRRERIEELLNFVELWDRKDDLVKHYSGGMKRRLEIARGLVHHPKILFLDEPTVGLDPQTRNHLWEYIKKLNEQEGMTVFFTTHYMEEADRNADRVIIVDHGTIVTEGTAKELKENTGSATLEDAFLALTGKVIREEEASSTEMMRNHRKMWRR